MVSFAGAAEGYEDVQQKQMQQMLEMLRMRHQMQQDAPMTPEMSPYYQGGPGQGAAGSFGQEAGPATFRPGIGQDPYKLIPYIRQKAIEDGIDPDVAVRVAMSEGLSNPIGDKGTSFGPYQLHVGGGLGDVYQKQHPGQNLADPANFKSEIDFALQNAAQGGWGPWHGAQRVGIGNFQGIGRPPVQMASAAGPGAPMIPRMMPGAPGSPGMPQPGQPQPPTPQNAPAAPQPSAGAPAGGAPGSAGVPPGAPGAPAMMPRAAGLPSREEYSNRLIRAPGMTTSKYTQLMGEYDRVYNQQVQMEFKQQTFELQQRKAQLDAQEKAIADQRKQAELDEKIRKDTATEEDRAKAADAKVKAAEAARKAGMVKIATQAKYREEEAATKEENRRTDAREAARVKAEAATVAEERRRERMEISVDLKQRPQIDDATADRLADEVIAGRLDAAKKEAGSGATGTANMALVDKRVTEKLAKSGASQEDINNATLDWMGREQGLKEIAKRGAKIDVVGSQVDAAVDNLETALTDVDVEDIKTRFPTINKLLNATEQELGSENLVRLRLSVANLQTQMSTLMRQGNMPTVSGREEAKQLINGDMSTSQLRSAGQVLKRESMVDREAVHNALKSATGQPVTRPEDTPDDPIQARVNKFLIDDKRSPQEARKVLDDLGTYTDKQKIDILRKGISARDAAVKKAAAKIPDKPSEQDVISAFDKAATQPRDAATLLNPATGGNILNKALSRAFTPPGEFMKQLQTFLPRRGENPPPTNYGGVVQ